MIYHKDSSGYENAMKGIRYKTLAYGANTSLTEFYLDRDTILPMHSHPHEQTGYLIRGRMVLIVGEERHEMKEGDAWSVPGNTPHGAEIIEDTVAVEIFSPVREDYIKRT